MKYIFSLFFLLLFSSVFSQHTFEKWYGGIQSDQGQGVVQLADSGYAVLGRSWTFTNGGSDLVLWRLDKFGDTIWVKHYGGAQNEFTNGSIQITQDGGFIFAGSSSSYGIGTPSAWNWYVVKTNGNGNEQWHKTWGNAPKPKRVFLSTRH